MDRRTFLKGAAGGLGTLFALKSGLAFAQETSGSTPTGFIHPTLASNSSEKVGARLVCLYDISGSVDNTEHDVQIEVMAEAIGSDDFRNAIFYTGGPQSIALCVADFGTTAAMRVPWVDIRKGDDDKLKLIAHEIRKLARRETGSTHHATALEYSITALDNCPWAGKRTIVDFLTDGENNEGFGSEERMLLARETLAKKHEATINALITLDQDPGLEDWARKNLITESRYIKADGTYLDPGFVKIVATQQTDQGAIVKYRDAMKMAFRRKLILEVAQLELEDLHTIVKAENLPGAGRMNFLQQIRPNI
ncbi:MAG: DUF1194 domain-containing protein [Micavibrio sp.]